MVSTFGVRWKLLARLAAPLLLAATLSACSSIPDWVDPTTWIGGDDQATSDQSGSDPAAADQAAGAQNGDTGAQTGADASAGANAAQTPDIASIPPKPAAPSTADDQKQVADSLAADRGKAQYSADSLRGGTEAAAPPPSAEPPQPAAAPASSAAPPPPDEQSAPASPSATDTAPPPADASSPSAAPAPTESNSAAASPPANSGGAPPPAPAANQVASTDSASASAPAAAPMAAEAPVQPAAPSSDMQAGFAPSRAPPLDPSVSQFVPQPILSRYQQTATAAATPGVAASAVAKPRHRHHKKVKAADASAPIHVAAADRQIPDVAWAEASSEYAATTEPEDRRTSTKATAPLQDASFDPGMGPFATPNSVSPAAVVFFSHDTTILGTVARNEVEAAVRAFAARGGKGYVRVVGHSSSRTANMPLARHLEFDFERSQARATAVARELIRDGVPADKVLVEAVGDSRPVYFESMPQGETGSRRAEIFLQS